MMNRKYFLGTSAAILTGMTLPFTKGLSARTEGHEETVFKIPAYLKSGDRIGITSPAGPASYEEIKTAVTTMESWGYRVIAGDTIGKKEFTRGGSDEERLKDFQKMLDDASVKAIMCARGGYGSVRIIDKIDWTQFKKKPKWVIGFSDITVLHSHIHRMCSVASIHSKMTNSFPEQLAIADTVMNQTIGSIHDAISGIKMKYTIPPDMQNRNGMAEGILVGGNLKTLESLSGSLSDIRTEGKILFLEDTGEYLYSIDRMFWNLKRTGKLKNLKALIIGGFKIKPDDPGEEFGKTLYDIVFEKIKDSSYPVCFGFPVGHQKANFALKCGVKHRISVNENVVTLIEVR